MNDHFITPKCNSKFSSNIPHVSSESGGQFPDARGVRGARDFDEAGDAQSTAHQQQGQSVSAQCQTTGQVSEILILSQIVTI